MADAMTSLVEDHPLSNSDILDNKNSNQKVDKNLFHRLPIVLTFILSTFKGITRERGEHQVSGRRLLLFARSLG
jgi:hypothetical protein